MRSRVARTLGHLTACCPPTPPAAHRSRAACSLSAVMSEGGESNSKVLEKAWAEKKGASKPKGERSHLATFAPLSEAAE